MVSNRAPGEGGSSTRVSGPKRAFELAGNEEAARALDTIELVGFERVKEAVATCKREKTIEAAQRPQLPEQPKARGGPTKDEDVHEADGIDGVCPRLVAAAVRGRGVPELHELLHIQAVVACARLRRIGALPQQLYPTTESPARPAYRGARLWQGPAAQTATVVPPWRYTSVHSSFAQRQDAEPSLAVERGRGAERGADMTANPRGHHIMMQALLGDARSLPPCVRPALVVLSLLPRYSLSLHRM